MDCGKKLANHPAVSIPERRSGLGSDAGEAGERGEGMSDCPKHLGCNCEAIAKLREEVVAQAIRWRKTKDYENEEADALCHDVDALLAAEGEKCNG
jgi:hypothetical protein